MQVLKLSPKARAGISWPLFSLNFGCLSGNTFLLITSYVSMRLSHGRIPASSCHAPNQVATELTGVGTNNRRTWFGTHMLSLFAMLICVQPL